MAEFTQIGVSLPRKESFAKVTGSAKYTDDNIMPHILHAKILTSSVAHAVIKKIDIKEALKASGVRAVVTGDCFSGLSGPVIEDRPIIAKGKVRYFGEPVAVVVADTEQNAMKALNLIKIEYEPLTALNSVTEAVKTGAPLIHQNLSKYTRAVEEVNPEANSNIADHVKIRKGDIKKGFSESEVVVEASFTLPQADHIAMETRSSRVQILPDGRVIVYTASQAPFSVRKEMSKYFNIPEGNVTVYVPFVGGGFGGKASVQLELIAYLASKAVGGRMVRISNTREEDITTSPSKIGVEAKLKIGALKDGTIKALESEYLVDCGAYADIGPRMAKAIAIDCSGPYNIENIWCDSISVYTNHSYTTAYRGFGHTCLTFCIERLLDKLAAALKIDPLELRIKNSIKEGHFSPTQVKLNLSSTGNLEACINKLKAITKWEEGNIIHTEDGKIRAKGAGCFWKTSNSPTNAISGVILTFNSDGSININSGCVEMGPSMKTTLTQILAEKLKMDVSRIHIMMGVDTRVSPEHWKTVASMTTFMAGRAVLRAAEDLIRQLKSLAAIVMKCPPEDLEVAEEKVFFRPNPEMYVSVKDLAHGYKYPNGLSVEGQIIGRGSYIMSHITALEKESGKGKPGPAWTVGAQAVEIEYDPKLYTYRLIKAVTVIDAGKVLNPKTTRGLLMGGMNMGLGLATREEFLYDDKGKLQNSTLRTYKVMRFGENPDYEVEFVETPQIDAPFGARGLAEHGILGVAAAFANAISLAVQAEFDKIPITPENIWKVKTGGKSNYDPL